jgi:hypothetical protein
LQFENIYAPVGSSTSILIDSIRYKGFESYYARNKFLSSLPNSKVITENIFLRLILAILSDYNRLMTLYLLFPFFSLNPMIASKESKQKEISEK